jgi:hypothetical protein
MPAAVTADSQTRVAVVEFESFEHPFLELKARTRYPLFTSGQAAVVQEQSSLRG